MQAQVAHPAVSTLDGPTTGPDAGWWQQPAPPTAAPRATALSGEGALPFAALLAFTSVQLLAPQNVFPALAQMRVALVSAGLAIVSHVVGRLLRGRPVMRFDRAVALAGGLLAWAIATIPLSYWPAGTVSLLLDLYVKSLAVFWLIANTVDTRERLRCLMWALALLTVPLALTAAQNFVSGVFLPGTATDRIMGYDAPLTKNPNDLALMLNLVLPLGVALFLSSRRPAVRGLLLAIMGLHVAGVVLTFSRAGFLSLATGALIYLVKLGRRGSWLPVAAVLFVCLAALPLLPSGYENRLATISDLGSDPTRSAQARWRDVVAATFFFLDHPIVGAGAGMDILALNEARGNRWVSVHNAYLEYAVDLGLPGLLLFVLLLWVCMRTARRVQRRCAQAGERRGLFLLAEGIEVSLVTFALAAFFHPVAYQFYFFYVGGLAMAAQAVSEAQGGAPPEAVA